MKKTFLSISTLIACTMAFPAAAQHLGSDRLVNNRTDQQLSAPDMAIAFNGWIYNAHRSGDSITVKVSHDQGLSWQPFTSLHTPGESYGPPSITVTGTDAGDLRLFIAGTRTQKQSGRQFMFVRRYNALTAAFEAEPLLQATEGSLYGYDLASDNGAGSKGVAGCSIALLYAAASANADSIIEKVSVDGGRTFAITHIVSAGPEHFRNVSLCYGRSDGASNGRYFMAWDAFDKPGSAFGKIYTSRSTTTVLSAPMPPLRIDNSGAATENHARNPVIAVSNDIDNDSASCTALVLMEAGNSNATAIYGLYNSRPHFTHYWQQAQVSPEGVSAAEPAIVYNSSSHQFAASYYNETGNSIQLWKAGLRRPQAWTLTSSNYADADQLHNPGPAVAADPASGQIAMSWAAPVSGNSIYFDAEYNEQSAEEIAALQAANEGRYNSLSWQSAATGDDGLFTIERSTDRLVFDAIATMPVQEHMSGYHFNDNNAPAGKSYYRIRYTRNGALQYSDIASADKDLLSAEGITLYPNPATHVLHIALPAAPAAGASLTVCDLSGRVLMHIPLQAIHTSVDVSRLAAGTYYATVHTDGTTQAVRFSRVAP